MTLPFSPTPRSGVILPSDFEFFRTHGYVVLPGAINADELVEMRALFDRDYKESNWIWRQFNDQVINCDALASSPAIDRVIRHPKILPAIEDLMGGPTTFSEICLRYMGRHAAEPRQGWHRDRPHLLDHPLRMDYIQLMVYLTDVDPGTHCFSISPESVDEPLLPHPDQLVRGGVVDIHGPAGTVVLFNVSALHTATVRRTQVERKTIQVYYGHASRPFLSNDSFIPPTFWHSHPDAGVRAFYGNLNDKTRLFLKGTGLENARP